MQVISGKYEVIQIMRSGMKLIIAKYKSREMSFGPREGELVQNPKKAKGRGLNSIPIRFTLMSLFFTALYISTVLLCASTYGIGDIQYIGNRDDRPEYSDPRSNYKFCRQ